MGRTHKKDLFGNFEDKVNRSLEIIKMYSNPQEPYYFANSGGKDSTVLRHLLIRSGVEFEAVHNITTLGAPEQIKFIKKHHPETRLDPPEKNFRQLVLWKLYPPTRLARYCCEWLKERGGEGRLKILGLRRAESQNRAKDRREVEICYKDMSRTINPIYHWTDNDVWRYINEQKLPYCKLYNQGYDRVGCMFCPMKPNRLRKQEATDYPGRKANIVKTFNLMLERRKEKELDTTWKTGEEVFKWWLSG